ncbi:MAG: type II toxin-antitoxin system VapC family toxin [Hyphomicrobiales bacterium]|nr:type II toxin-antitoxin system VapC family toxin [Hyphomicrobiales bacterium]MBV9589307.1 type II toxin-antitoxin system VapC family toxin [Hyphomicrobiales bacterium]MBV9754257.1 type II toxin-antitoxin system VapC family toxin [Hyphomicrobiales bacterium]
MILLDTNVLSELIRPAPEPAVTGWVGAQPSTSLFISAMTEAELLFGLAMLRDGKRRHQLAQAIDGLLMEDFAGRILPFDSPAASAYARIASDRRAAGRPLSQFDAQIASIAASRNAILATRDLHDFDGCGVRVINPWQGVHI